jgi:uncharacterized membrane protein HdeD (DUF308 family)
MPLRLVLFIAINIVIALLFFLQGEALYYSIGAFFVLEAIVLVALDMKTGRLFGSGRRRKAILNDLGNSK